MHLVGRRLRHLHFCFVVPASGVALTSGGAQLAPPAQIVVTPGAGSVSVAWSAARGAVSYDLMRTPDPRQAPVRIASLPNTSLGYRDMQLPAGVMYYQVVSVGMNGARAPSALYQLAAAAVTTATTGMVNGVSGLPPARASVLPPGAAATAQPVGASNPLYQSSQQPDSAFLAEYAARLAAAMENQLSATMGPEDLNAIVAGIRQGGSAGMALATELSNQIANVKMSSDASASGQQVDTTAINTMLATLPQQGPAASLASYFRSKLTAIKVRRPTR